ncbi:hypothetical protein [Nonomuraea helvata]|uniref:Tetratricopeptide repeat protein n=1 Tax=Nonomuraea helvata TaxID=37484 RepID=A0ABV5SJ69_9ACTN
MLPSEVRPEVDDGDVADLGERLSRRYLERQDGDTDQAVRYLERARDTGDATFGPQADRLLGRLTR